MDKPIESGKLEESKKAYKKIFGLIKKYKDVCAFNVEDLERKSKIHLFGIELRESYGLNINPMSVDSIDWVRVGQYGGIGWFGEKYRRTVSWSDSGEQPNNELLFYLGFSTGAYIFGDDYPVSFFNKFFLELIEYAPKYIDTNNHCLYYAIGDAKEIFNNFDSILAKYRELNREDVKQRKIIKMKEELAKLES
jgi:hypothetical protein